MSGPTGERHYGEGYWSGWLDAFNGKPRSVIMETWPTHSLPGLASGYVDGHRAYPDDDGPRKYLSEEEKKLKDRLLLTDKGNMNSNTHLRENEMSLTKESIERAIGQAEADWDTLSVSAEEAFTTLQSIHTRKSDTEDALDKLRAALEAIEEAEASVAKLEAG